MKDFVMDGYVCKGADTRSTQTGKLVTKFTLNSPDYDRSSKQSTPAFFRCEYWHSGPNDPKAANIAEGAVLLVWGAIGYDQWEDRNTGAKRSETVFKVREIGLIRPPASRPQQQPYGAQSYPQQYAPQPAPAPAMPLPAPVQNYQPVAAPPAMEVPVSVYDQDIPF
ncbi:MAG: single-stranded DNA-binding protein [Gordonibacter sp.]|uniref:single-stranded DNA-binding protein n=1 Tax=Gordonibacter sp. TaxID=1968902 RepID=UPI002FC72BBF